MRKVSEPAAENAAINISKFTVGGGPAGIIVAASFVVLGLIGLPSARWFLLGSVSLGGLFAMILRRR